MGSGWGRKRPAAAQDAQFERVLREALRAVAESVEPADDGLERIHRRLREPWLVRQVPRLRVRYADWLPIVLAMAGAVIIAVAGAVAAGVGHHGPPGVRLSATGGNVGTSEGPGSVTGGGGRSSGLDSAEASAAQLNPVPPGPTQANQPRRPGGVSSVRVKPSQPAASPPATGRDTGQPSAAATSCPPGFTGTPSATPGPPSPGVPPSPTPSPAAGTPAVGTPAVGSRHPACDDGQRRQ